MNEPNMSRRDLLRACAGTLGAILFRGTIGAEMSMRSAVSAVDHLLLGVSDLDYGMQFVEEKSGIKPVIGGVHPGRGTRNALLSLGDKHYLEIIAPDPAQKEYQSTFDVRALKEPALITWAASAANIDALAKTAQDSGFKVAGPAEGSRKKGDGTTLRWKAFRAETAIAAEPVDVIPFFIEWAADSIHPSQDSQRLRAGVAGPGTSRTGSREGSVEEIRD